MGESAGPYAGNEMGGGCKKVDLSSTQGALCTVSVFFILHFTYLGVRTHPTHPLLTGLVGIEQLVGGMRDGLNGK